MYVWIFLTEDNNRTAKNDETNLSRHILKLEKYLVQPILVFQHCCIVLQAENILGTASLLIDCYQKLNSFKDFALCKKR